MAQGSIETVDSTPVDFYYMREYHYFRPLGLDSTSSQRCFIPEGHPDGPTILEVIDTGISEISIKVNGILLGLWSETFGTEFSVSYIPDGKERYIDQISIGGIDIAGKDAKTVIGEVRELVNKKLTEGVTEAA